MSTQPPYHTSTFGAPNQDPSTSTPIGTQVGAAPPTDPLTGPAPSTAGPHQSNMGNRFDPRVDARTGETGTMTTNQTGYPAEGGYGAPGESHVNPEHEAQYVPHGEQREHGTATDSSAAGSKSAQKGEQLGHSVKSLFAGVHVSFFFFLLRTYRLDIVWWTNFGSSREPANRFVAVSLRR